MAEHSDFAPHRAPIGNEVTAKGHRLARMDFEQPGEDLEETRLAGTVRTAQVHHFALGDFQRCSSKEREAAGERYGLVKTNGRRHGDPEHGRGPQVPRARRAGLVLRAQPISGACAR